MPFAVGTVLALFTILLGKLVGFGRDRAFYPTVVIVTASYYALFAVLGGDTHALIVETVVMTVFVAIAVAGFKLNAWFVVAALLAHGAFDLVHGQLVSNPGMPDYWPSFCLTYDVVLAAGVAIFLSKGMLGGKAVTT